MFPPRPMRPAWSTLTALGLAGMLLAPARAQAQVSAEESAQKVKPAEGLEARLWASEPMVVNPTNMDVDSRGRVWVSEGLNYRLTRNKRLSRVEAADKIKILEDTDGDGKADKMTVFADNIFPVPMGLAVEEHYDRQGKYTGCKVYVGNSPDLLVLEDTDGDDRADRRSVLLTGFGGVDSDHGVHGMVLGLDGKLYFTHGDGCCSVQQDHSERKENFRVTDASGRFVWSDQLANTLRANRDGTSFEIIADRQRNNYETCLNSFGNMFTSDNDDDGNRGCRIIWVMDGGHYGYQTPGSPRHWGEDVPGNVPKLVGTGNGSPCGVMAYEGRLLPGEYYGGLFEAEAGTRQINFFPLTRKGAAFRTEYKVLLASDDPWFRPVDVTAAPDGSVFVADWYDSGVGGHAFRDQTTGRIYRVTPRVSKPLKSPTADFASVPGLIAALQSPVIAAQDAARRLLIERAAGPQGDGVVRSLEDVFTRTGDPVERARALWVLHAVKGDAVAVQALRDKDARIREQAVRILGRDVSRNGHVELKASATPMPPPRALAHLNVLAPLAHDPDAGVRRELILAVRNLPTASVGEALKALARSWDGQDRWYLEALGLALDGREPAYIAELFDGTLYGDLGLPLSGKATGMALPPYFPVDRNEAFLATGEQEHPASPLTRTLGLAWRVHRAEVLPLLGRIMPSLTSPDLQEAADDVLSQVTDPKAGEVMADLALKTTDPVRLRQILTLLTRRLSTAWKGAQERPRVAHLIRRTLEDRQLRAQGIQLVAASGDARYGPMLGTVAQDTKAPEDVRIAAVEALGAIKPPQAQHVLTHLIGETRGKASNPIAEAAVRTLPQLFDARKVLAELITSTDHPLALRREALRTLGQGEGARRIVAMAREGKLPAELKTEATTLVYSHRDRTLRQEAADVLPPPKLASGRALPPIGMILRRDGNADKGRDVFFRSGANACGSCHRVQGRGQWVGPDLSTIGTKYGKDELLRSILNPSAAIGYNFQAHTVALKDGRVFTGLPVEQAPDRLVLKLADGQRVTVKPQEVEDKKVSEVSLMPEGLAETMTDDDLVDLLAYLSTLRQPVSIVGQYHLAGPLEEGDAVKAAEREGRIDVTAPLKLAEGKALPWRRLSANAESLVDLASLGGDDARQVLLLATPINSPAEQDAQLVLDTKAAARVWLGGKRLELPAPSEGKPLSTAVKLPRGPSDLVIMLPTGASASLVTTIVAPQPLEFSTTETKEASR